MVNGFAASVAHLADDPSFAGRDLSLDPARQPLADHAGRRPAGRSRAAPHHARHDRGRQRVPGQRRRGATSPSTGAGSFGRPAPGLRGPGRRPRRPAAECGPRRGRRAVVPRPVPDGGLLRPRAPRDVRRRRLVPHRRPVPRRRRRLLLLHRPPRRHDQDRRAPTSRPARSRPPIARRHRARRRTSSASTTPTAARWWPPRVRAPGAGAPVDVDELRADARAAAVGLQGAEAYPRPRPTTRCRCCRAASSTPGR